MDRKVIENMTAEERILFYHGEIEKRTPPVTEHDHFMLEIYQNLLAAAEEDRQG